MNRPLDSELHAYVDRQLAPARAAEVEDWLAANPEDAARVHGWRVQKEALHAAYDGLLEAPVPDRLEQAARRLGARRRLPLGLAAAVGWLVIGGVVGFVVRGQVATPAAAPADRIATLPRQAAIAHVVYTPEVRHPVEVGADQEAHLVQWLSKRLGNKLTIPRLGEQGFDLVGGRLLPGDGGPVAQFMYQDKSGQRLTLYVRQDGGKSETAFRFASEGKVGVFYWVDGPFGYALSGELPRERLLAVAELGYRQLGGR